MASRSRKRDGPDDGLMLIKKIKLLIAGRVFLFSFLYLSLPTSRILSCSPSFSIRAQSKPDPWRAPRWYQSSLMSAWLIGRNFINARSIEIGGDIGEVRG